jgi:hypothetical protein
MNFRRLILSFCILAQCALLIYSNHQRTGMLKTMHEQNDALEKASSVLKFQSHVIEYQSRVIQEMQSDCATTGTRVVYQ